MCNFCGEENNLDDWFLLIVHRKLQISRRFWDLKIFIYFVCWGGGGGGSKGEVDNLAVEC